ncbi:hypothetical protein ARTHRO9AX_80146 [Arthrobacter sp. 9AX]|nr:hypothetical protein ARTHRO9AX_80146 [Arthrobacter sp. 9AX]
MRPVPRRYWFYNPETLTRKPGNIP